MYVRFDERTGNLIVGGIKSEKAVGFGSLQTKTVCTAEVLKGRTVRVPSVEHVMRPVRSCSMRAPSNHGTRAGRPRTSKSGVRYPVPIFSNGRSNSTGRSKRGVRCDVRVG